MGHEWDIRTSSRELIPLQVASPLAVAATDQVTNDGQKREDENKKGEQGQQIVTEHDRKARNDATSNTIRTTPGAVRRIGRISLSRTPAPRRTLAGRLQRLDEVFDEVAAASEQQSAADGKDQADG